MRVYAIDFGTSNSLLAAATADGVVPPIPLDPFSKNPEILRSLIYFANRKQAFFGAQAIEEFVARDLEGRLIRSVKRFLPMRSFLGTQIDDRPMALEDLIGTFLRELRVRADQHFGEECKSAVLGRPARFALDDADDLYAQTRLEKAARIAGFEHIEFLPEPVAAAREYQAAAGVRGGDERLVLVADFGGGTSDYTVIRIHSGPFQPSDVLAIGGVPLAGDALDGSIMRKQIAPHFGADVQYKVPFGQNVLTMPKALMEKICSPAEMSVLRKRDTMEFFKNVQQWALKGDDQVKMDRLFALIEDQLGFAVFEEIERVKRELSDSKESLFNFSRPPTVVKEWVSVAQFNEATESRRESIIQAMDSTVKLAGIEYSQIALVCCTGGTARVPAIRDAIISRVGVNKIQDRNFFRAVVEGLAERARELALG